jgi:hypothetical protein
LNKTERRGSFLPAFEQGEQTAKEV